MSKQHTITRGRYQVRPAWMLGDKRVADPIRADRVILAVRHLDAVNWYEVVRNDLPMTVADQERLLDRIDKLPDDEFDELMRQSMSAEREVTL